MANPGAPYIPDPYQFDQQGRPTRLIWANNPQCALSHRVRSKVPPRVDPNTDPTIATVIARQEEHIADMIQAVYNLDTARDGPKFEGRTLFARGGDGSIPVQDTEAACRTLFQQVLSQCHNGWCGHENQDRLAKTTEKTAADDMNANCLQRITNIIDALRDWKSVCREIVYSDEKIAHLANAPSAVYRDKTTQQNANETKKRTRQKEHEALMAQRNQEEVAVDDKLPQATPGPKSKAGRAKKVPPRRKQAAARVPRRLAAAISPGHDINRAEFQQPSIPQNRGRKTIRPNSRTLDLAADSNHGYGPQHGINSRPISPPAVYAPIELPYGITAYNHTGSDTPGQQYNTSRLGVPWAQTGYLEDVSNASVPQLPSQNSFGLEIVPGDINRYCGGGQVGAVSGYAGYGRAPEYCMPSNAYRPTARHEMRIYPAPAPRYTLGGPMGHIPPIDAAPHSSHTPRRSRTLNTPQVPGVQGDANINLIHQNTHSTQFHNNESQYHLHGGPSIDPALRGGPSIDPALLAPFASATDETNMGSSRGPTFHNAAESTNNGCFDTTTTLTGIVSRVPMSVPIPQTAPRGPKHARSESVEASTIYTAPDTKRRKKDEAGGEEGEDIR